MNQQLQQPKQLKQAIGTKADIHRNDGGISNRSAVPILKKESALSATNTSVQVANDPIMNGILQIKK